MLKQQLDQLRHNAYTPPDAVIAGSAAQPPYEETPGSAAQDVSTQTDVGHCPAEQSVSAAPAETSEQTSPTTDQQPSAGAVSEPSEKAASPTVANPDGTQLATDASDADIQQKNQFTSAWRRVVPAQQADAAVEQTAGQPAAAHAGRARWCFSFAPRLSICCLTDTKPIYCNPCCMISCSGGSYCY